MGYFTNHIATYLEENKARHTTSKKTKKKKIKGKAHHSKKFSTYFHFDNGLYICFNLPLKILLEPTPS